ncbi:unnamed protein product, partial [Phaeothamnion confervicola]
VIEQGPTLASAQFSDTGAIVVVTFDQSTDRGEATVLGTDSTFDCGALFVYDGVSDDDVCYWADGESV